jgi:hypothetical protein
MTVIFAYFQGSIQMMGQGQTIPPQTALEVRAGAGLQLLALWTVGGKLEWEGTHIRIQTTVKKN